MEIKDCKLRKVISCSKDEDLVNVAKKLRDSHERHIIVTDKEKPIGIISTTDINNRVVAENKNPKATKAGEVMTSPIMIKELHESLARAYFEMLKSNIFSSPITDKGKLVGVLDLKEAMNHLIKHEFKE
jgi:CBS domain-containing protein